MNQDAQVVRPPHDAAKLGVAAVLVLGGLAAYYHFAELHKLLRILLVVGSVGAGIAVALLSSRGRELLDYARQSQIEVRKIVRPTRQETLQTTGAVIVIVMITALFLWVLDLLLSGFTRWLLGHGG